MEPAACPPAHRHRVHHLDTSNPPGSPVVSEKAVLSLCSTVPVAMQDLTGSSPRQSQPSALLLSLLLFIQELLLLPPMHSPSPLRAGTLPHIHARYLLLLSGPSREVPGGSCASS